MEILLVTTSYPLRRGSVSGVFVKKLADQIKKFADLTVVTPADDKHIVDSDIKPARYAPQKMQLLAHSPGGIPVALKSNLFAWLLLPTLIFSMFYQCIVHCRNKDVIVANWSINGVLAGLAAKIFSVPVITILRGSDVSSNHTKRKNSLILLLAIKLSTKVVCVSDNFYKIISASYPKYRHKFIVIPNGVDNEYLHIKTSDDPALFVLTTVGNLNPKKGVQDILEACTVLRKRGVPFALNIIGDGPEKKRLVELTNALRLSGCVNFMGSIPNDQIPRYLGNSNIFVFASYSEGRANVLLEAMASGLTIVASQINANKELITHNENGFLFETGSPHDLAEKIIALTESKPLRDRLSQSARKFIVVNGLSWESTGDKYHKLLNSCMEQAKCAE